MQGVLAGFAAIAAVIVLGYMLARIRVLGEDSYVVLARLVFFVAAPALLLTVLAKADVSQVLSAHLAVAALSLGVSALVYVVLARTVWRRGVGDTVIGALSSSYVNAGNLGLPVAVYVLGDASYVAPVLLLQLLVVTPLAFVLLDASASGRRPSVTRAMAQPLRNPITVGSLIGLLLALTGWQLPTFVSDPLALVGGMAVPGALLAYGISLRTGPRPMAGGSALEVTVVTTLKLVLQPAVAYVVGHHLLGLDGVPLLAVVVTAALPTAQNIFVYATRYDRATILARDAIFLTTILAVPVMVVVAALLS